MTRWQDGGSDLASGAYVPFEDVKLDDLVTIHTGTGQWDYNEQAMPVAAITLQLRTGGDWDVWYDLGSSYSSNADRKFQVTPVVSHNHPPKPELCPAAVAASSADVLAAYDWDENVAEPIAAIAGLGQPAATTGIGMRLDPSPEGYAWHTNGTQRYMVDDMAVVNAAVTAGSSYRFVSRWGSAGFVVDWLSGTYNGTAGAWTLISSDSLGAGGAGYTDNDVTLVAPVGATAIRLRSTSGTGLNVERVTITGSGAAAAQNPHAGNSNQAARCDHDHDHLYAVLDHGHIASAIPIDDDGNYFTGTSVEAALQELGGGGGGADEKTKVSANDTTAGYLNGKLVAGSGVTLTENTDGGNETLTIASTAGGGSYSGNVVAVEPITRDAGAPAAAAPGGNFGQMMLVNIPGPMRVRGLQFRVNTTGAGTWEWGLFDASSAPAACTKLAGGSGTMSSLGLVTLAATAAPILIAAGTYFLIVKVPASGMGSIFRWAVGVGTGVSKHQATYTWDDTPDVTTGWVASSTVFEVILLGDIDGSNQW